MSDSYREYAPAQALRPFVACYWTSSVLAGAPPRRVLPDGCIDILVSRSNGDAPEATIVGAMTQPVLFAPGAAVSLVAVRFRPGGAVPFLRLPADSITDAQIDLSDAWRSDRLAERVFEEDTRAETPVRRLEQALLARLPGAERPEARVAAAARLFEQGAPDVDAVAAAVDVSRQHLIRLFRRHVGLGPKQLARVLRMQRLRARIEGVPRPDWPALALDAGYYDQAHMIAECRRLAGVTPTALADL